MITKVVLNEATTNRLNTTLNKIESTHDVINLSGDENDDDRAGFDESLRLYLSEVRNC